jgi:hypothetical protein
MQPLTDIAAQIKALVDDLAADCDRAAADRDTAKVALADCLAAVPRPEMVPLDPAFPQQKAGLYSPGGYVGKGRTLTTYQGASVGVAAIAAAIAAMPRPDDRNYAAKTDPYAYLRTGGLDAAHPVDNAVARDLALRGGTLGHPANGLVCGPGRNARISRVDVEGVQGESNGPPTETALVGVWGQTGAIISDCVLDGRDATGQQIASSPLMLSGCTDTLVEGLDIGWAAFGFGAANWHMGGFLHYLMCHVHDCRKGWNFEQLEPDTHVVLEACQVDAIAAGYLAQISTYKKGRAYLDVLNPVGDGPVNVKTYSPAANGGQNGMLDSDIRVFVRGRLATQQRLQLVAK